MNVIETKGLTKYYGKSRGVINVDLAIGEGEIFGFIGPNGAGKSTTIRLLLSFIYPTGGSASIFGLDCFKQSEKIKRDIGYLPSEVNYYDDMKVKDLFDYSARFYNKDCSKRIKELCSIFEVDLNKNIDDLSLGNKKKAGIVQALLHQPRLLILDEPTSGLDPLMQSNFFDTLRQEKERGTTIFFSSHVLSEVQKMCDRVAIIKEGRILKTEQIEKLGSKHKRIRVELGRAFPKEAFDIPGVNDFKVKENGYEFLYSGKMDVIIKKLAEAEVENLFIEEPTLEEIFMHYYEKEGNNS